jgi:ADP-dependent NAD(P)H-hydrate dehydratase
MRPAAPAAEVVTALPVLAPRAADSNKGNYGRILVIAGSRGMSGAGVLSASAALRGGAGLVYLAVPKEIQPIVAAANPCYLTAALPEDSEGRLDLVAVTDLLALAEGKDVIAAGPGLGQGHGVTAVVEWLVTQASVPLVLDADGLNAIRGRAGLLKGGPGPRVLTPHPGEFARLMGTDIRSIQANRQEMAVRFAAEHGVVLLLKGHGTIVTDGRRMYQNPSGNPGMATGGTGDVLTGLIAALLGQGLEPFAAAQLGAWWHGRAGDLARDELGEVCLIASDLLNYLPRAWRER